MSLVKQFVKYWFPYVFEAEIEFIQEQHAEICQLQEHVECQKSYIQVLEDKIEFQKNKNKKVINNSPAIIPKQEIQVREKYVHYTRDWHVIVNVYRSNLPPHSMAEVLVSDGDVVGVASYCDNTKSFLKTFGAQTMRVPDPKYWQYLPAPPRPDDTQAYQSSISGKSKSPFEITYNRN